MWLLLTRYNSDGTEDKTLPVGSDFAYHTNYKSPKYLRLFASNVQKATFKRDVAAGYYISDYEFRELPYEQLISHGKLAFRNEVQDASKCNN